MTSRLKKRLGNLGIGTPLPPLEKSKDTGEFVPLWKQEVRDEKGRRRLHGAFTGGFSAGYFNTAGSKEGWTPSTFISSRTDRSKKKAARPEDFMDEKDLQDIRESQNLVDTTEEMDLTVGTQLGHGDDEEQKLRGARIFQKMGWRIGQGIGPRVTLRQRKLQDLQACRQILESDLDIAEDDEEAKKHTFAPRDTPVLVVARKDNTHGIGYRLGMSLNESVGARNAVSGPKISAGFGLGALNDADEDDFDVYDGGSVSKNRNRTAYDIIDREEEEKVSIGTRADRQNEPKRPTYSTQVFQDGKPVLAGFVLSDKPVAEDRWFPLPAVPPGWKPDPKRVWDKENSQKPDGPLQPLTQKWSRNTISADQRGSMLGETPLPSAPRSVFEYISQKDRERIKNITSGATHPESGDTLPSASSAAATPATIKIPRTEPYIALAALKGRFVPFASNPGKQARYTAYLESQATIDTPPPPPKQLPGQTIDDFNKELEDYAKAAVIFKPLSGAMAGRFTSAAIVEQGPTMQEGLYTPTAEDRAKEAELQKVEDEKVSPKVHAARMGMYGPMTRETQPWQPARLLCKRFKVKDPTPAMEEMSADAPWAAATADVDPAGAAAGSGGDQPSALSVGSSSTSTGGGGRRDLANIGLGEDESQGQDTLTYQRPAMEVFKAIFTSDDEDSDDEAQDEKDDVAPVAEPESEPATAPPPPAAMVAESAKPGSSETGVVEVTTFKPTFVPREGTAKKDSDRAKDKKEKKKKKEKSLVSFPGDEDGPLQILPKDRPRKKRRKDKETNDDESMWVEKPAPTR
ncbi:hypothetical protein GGX14DRAFT_547288 [Mycena pura]|uniref:G-patch domain-containing protein n=1 Tax=Mycena pura TaxID=153505 RepID=A0AAD7E6T9_9AGAR|nr:hypothetical protein GGX14DRAFT_547288 [Mycena pura]